MNSLTTGQVARIFGCSPQLVARMVDDGKLEGHRLAFSKHRRINPQSVLDAALEAGMPIVGKLAEIQAELLDNTETNDTLEVEADVT